MPPKRLYWINGEKNAGGYPHELPLHALLRELGIEVVSTVWDRDPLPRLGKGEHVVVRTPWDYLGKLPRFTEWLNGLPAERVHNSAKILRWNFEKTYLRELERAGVRIVPTVWMSARTEDEVRSTVAGAFPGKSRVVKPVKSASSFHTYRLAPRENPPEGAFIDRPAMVQPYLEEIETDGERSLVFFGGQFSHGIRKRPKAGDFRVQESHGGLFSEMNPTATDREFGVQVLAAIQARFPAEPAPLYARVDYVSVGGVPHLMEAELLEPDLYFHHAPGAAERFAALLAGLPE